MSRVFVKFILLGETCFRMKTPVGEAEIRSPLTGRVNVYNLLAASAAAWTPMPMQRTMPFPGRCDFWPNGSSRVETHSADAACPQ